MKGLGQLIRLQKLKVDEKRRELGQLELLLAEFVGRAEALEAEIAAEKEAAAGTEAGYIYGAYAKAALGRRETIRKSIVEVTNNIDKVRSELTDLFRAQKRFEIARDQRLKESEYHALRKEQAELDELGTSRHHRATRAS